MARKRAEPEAESAHLQIEDDGLVIVSGNGHFKLPKDAVDQLVSSLVISGFGPQTVAQFNMVLMFRDMKAEQDALPNREARHTAA